MELYGRKTLYCDVKEINEKNIISVLQSAYNEFTSMQSEISYLLDYDKGKQEKVRKKTYRPEIDNWFPDNVANEITEFKLGYIWGSPITLVQRGENDTGKENESLPISMLNEFYQTQNINDTTQKLGRYVEVCAVGYTYVDINTDYMDGDSPFIVESLDPGTTFVVRSNYYLDKRIVLAVTFRKESGNIYFTCFSKDRRYEIKNLVNIVNGEKSDEWAHGNRSGEKNPLGMIPIVEWVRSHDRMGCFERQIPELNNLNLLVSDFTNDVDQNTQAVWWLNDSDLPEEEIYDSEGNVIDTQPRKLKNGDVLNTYTTPDGKQPIFKPMTIDYDYEGMLNNIMARRALILQKCNVPQRSAVGNGATGVAMDDATGWNHAEAAAKKQQMIMEAAKMREIKLVLRAIQISPDVPGDSPLKTIRYTDIQPVIVRNRGYELINKSNALATLLGHGVYGLQAFKAVDIFPDVNQAWEDSRDLIEKYQESVFTKGEATSIPDRLQGDLSDNVNQSPTLDGNTQENVNEG